MNTLATALNEALASNQPNNDEKVTLVKKAFACYTKDGDYNKVPLAKKDGKELPIYYGNIGVTLDSEIWQDAVIPIIEKKYGKPFSEIRDETPAVKGKKIYTRNADKESLREKDNKWVVFIHDLPCELYVEERFGKLRIKLFYNLKAHYTEQNSFVIKVLTVMADSTTPNVFITFATFDSLANDGDADKIRAYMESKEWLNVINNSDDLEDESLEESSENLG